MSFSYQFKPINYPQSAKKGKVLWINAGDGIAAGIIGNGALDHEIKQWFIYSFQPGYISQRFDIDIGRVVLIV